MVCIASVRPHPGRSPSRPPVTLDLRAAGLALLSLLAVACDASPVWHLDGGPRPDSISPVPDSGPLPDAAAPLFAEVTVWGCHLRTVGETSITCQGPAPLSLRFGALVPAAVERYVWDFGDGSAPSGDPAPSHQFGRPGVFSVTLVVSTPSGLVAAARPVQVSVTAAPLGAYCTADVQCEGGRCLCGAESGDLDCPPALQGTCSAPCPNCGDTGLCVDLTVPDATDVPDWRGLTCLPACESDLDCNRAGFGCSALPTRDATGERTWDTACLPDLLAPLGQRCTGASGQPDDRACASGHCAPLGRFGLCTEPCSAGSCPPGSDCALLSAAPGVAEPLCLVRCDASRPCTADPALACSPPDPSGDLGFVILSPEAPPGATYCAPRRCSTGLDCPSGLCDLASGGFCL